MTVTLAARTTFCDCNLYKHSFLLFVKELLELFMRHELLVAVEDGDVEVGVGMADEAPAKIDLPTN